MEIRQLDTIRAVVECGGYKKAGEKLHLSHPAVHRQVKLLEQELGERVFQRVGRRVQLTEAGKRIFALGNRVHNEINDVIAEIRDLVNLEGGELRVGTATTMLMFFLPQVVARFRRRHPKVVIHVATTTVRQIIAEVASGELDLGLIFNPPDSEVADQGTHREQLYEEEFVLGVSNDHPLARRRNLTAADVDGLPVLAYSKQSTIRQFIDNRLTAAGVRTQSLMELENEETMVRMLQQGSAAAFLSRPRVLADKICHFRIRGVPLKCDVCLVYPRKGYLSHAARELAQMCQQECQHPG